VSAPETEEPQTVLFRGAQSLSNYAIGLAGGKPSAAALLCQLALDALETIARAQLSAEDYRDYETLRDVLKECSKEATAEVPS
jgi:hypothetical protein